jgi:hypothetical protein
VTYISTAYGGANFFQLMIHEIGHTYGADDCAGCGETAMNPSIVAGSPVYPTCCDEEWLSNSGSGYGQEYCGYDATYDPYDTCGADYGPCLQDENCDLDGPTCGDLGCCVATDGGGGGGDDSCTQEQWDDEGDYYLCENEWGDVEDDCDYGCNSDCSCLASLVMKLPSGRRSRASRFSTFVRTKCGLMHGPAEGEKGTHFLTSLITTRTGFLVNRIRSVDLARASGGRGEKLAASAPLAFPVAAQSPVSRTVRRFGSLAG